MFRILVINPGSTSSKVAIYEDETEVHEVTIDHPMAELSRYAHISDQYALRRDAVMCTLTEAGVAISDLACVVGRGGMLRPLRSGTYLVNDHMLHDARYAPREHAATLGSIIAHEIASQAGIPAYVVDPVTVDEFDPIARVSGLPCIERRSESHALNIKAAARRAARSLGTTYPAINLIVAHLGSGISVTAHRRGQMVDINQALDGTGPFAPERAGGLPVGDTLRLVITGQYSAEEVLRMVRHGGLAAHLGTNDAREVERRIAAGDEHAHLIYQAMAYQIAKEIGLMATVLKGDVQAVVLTGGLAYSAMLVGWIRERVEWIAPLILLPGQQELLAMAQGALRVLRGEEQPLEY